MDLFNYIPYLVPLIMFGAGIFNAITARIKHRRGFHTTGKVVRMEGRFTTSGNFYFFPIVRFGDETGEEKEMELPVGGFLFRRGQQVDVTYYQGRIHLPFHFDILLSVLMMASGIVFYFLFNSFFSFQA